MVEQRLITTQQRAQYLGVPVATIHRWRYVGGGPPAIKVGRHLRFDPDDIAAWIENRKDDTEAGAAQAAGASGGC